MLQQGPVIQNHLMVVAQLVALGSSAVGPECPEFPGALRADGSRQCWETDRGLCANAQITDDLEENMCMDTL